MRERVLIQTPDQVILVGSFFRTEPLSRCVLLFHMMPADRASWHPFQDALAGRGIASLAIDFRGHGESLTKAGQAIDYQTFNEAEHQASSIDVETAFRWVINRGLSSKQIGMAGASIGANLALQFAAQEPGLAALLLLSPGLNYHGVETGQAIRRLSPSQALLMAASQGDDQTSFEDAGKLMELAPCQTKAFRPFVASGHGTNLFLSHPEFLTESVAWFDQHLSTL